jgi:hypothetical protein
VAEAALLGTLGILGAGAAAGGLGSAVEYCTEAVGKGEWNWGEFGTAVTSGAAIGAVTAGIGGIIAGRAARRAAKEAEEAASRAAKEAEEAAARTSREAEEAASRAAKEAEEAAPKGARGPASGRPFNPDKAGGPIVPKTTEGVSISHEGVDQVEKHLSRFGPDEANQKMIQRARDIADGKIEPTQADKNFYTHELDEFERYKKLGWEQGQPSNPDEAYELWNNAHTAALEDYGLKEGPGVLYHPDAQP